jgi:hypothetical protein
MPAPTNTTMGYSLNPCEEAPKGPSTRMIGLAKQCLRLTLVLFTRPTDLEVTACSMLATMPLSIDLRSTRLSSLVCQYHCVQLIRVVTHISNTEPDMIIGRRRARSKWVPFGFGDFWEIDQGVHSSSLAPFPAEYPRCPQAPEHLIARPFDG